ncbi:MAG: hypothetical protein JRF33_23305 [Deltaproteobacteria bacterium]|nr:hypothetical protein [Deltaproteobacteria bacterium]
MKTMGSKYLMIYLVFVAAAALSCGQGDYQSVSKTIGGAGGTVEHPEGFALSFEEGSFAQDVDVLVSEVGLPQALPNQIEVVSKAFKVDTGGVDPARPVMIRFSLDSDQKAMEEGLLVMFRWDGEKWGSLGGQVDQEDGDFISHVTGFSVFILGTGRSLHKKFEFKNNGPFSAAVFVADYELAHPDLDMPITFQLGVPVFPPPYNHPVGRFHHYPQGWFQFCAEWEEDNEQGTDIWHKFMGGTKPDWTYSLDLNTDLDFPPIVQFDTGITSKIEGPCPPAFILNEGGTQGIAISGNWTGVNGPISSMCISDTSWDLVFVGNDTHADIVEYSNETETCIVRWDINDYEKIAWRFESNDLMAILFYESESTLDDARNDTDFGDEEWYTFSKDD